MNSVAIVTGGTRGIGLEISQELKEKGYSIAAFYNSNEKAAKEFEENVGGKAYKVNVAEYASCEKAYKKIEKEQGRVDVLVNNAGITKDTVLHKMSEEDWQQVLDTNLSSCFNMCRVVIQSMRDNGFGRIVNISSINGQKGQFGQVNYSAAKAGMIGLTKALALEAARKGITVNAICPGYIKTDMTDAVNAEVLDSIIKQIPVGRLGKAEEIAAIIGFLVSKEAGFITGSTITANGGQYLT